PRREHEGDPIEQWTVRKFPGQRFREKWATLEIEDYPRNRLILVAVNTAAVDRDEEIGPNKTIKSLPADSFEVAAVMLTPPIVTSFSVEVDEAEGDEVQWRPVWKVVREPASRPGTWRTRTILNEGIRYDEQHDPEIRFRVLTSRPVLRPPTLYVDRKGLRLRPGAGSTAYWSPRRLEYRTAFETVVESSFFFDAAAKRLKRGENVVEVEVAVGGRDSWGGYVDGRPETPPGLSVQDDGSLQVTSWEGDFVLGGKIDRLSGRKLPVHMREPVSYLKTVVARQNGKEIYRAAWRPNDEREGARQLDVAVSETYDADADMEVSLRFSQPVLDVTVRLASGKQPDYREGYRVELPAPAELGADAYSFTIPPSEAVAKILKEDQRLGFLVDARTKDGPRIDANPRTAAWFDWDDKRWYGLEENIRYGGRTSDGGTDEWHRLNAAGRSIVLLLDASGSMKKAGRIAEAKQGISDAVAKLRAADEVALIAFFGCHDIRTLVAFTEDHDSVVKAVRNVKPSGDTPLGDAIRFANNYLERAARHKQRKLLVFSDGKTTCGDSAANAIAEVEAGAPEPEREQEDVPRELRWTVYRVGGDGSAYVPKYWVEAIEYRESDHEDDAKDQARLTIRRHPVSYVSSRGRTVWSINWSRTREQDRKEAQGARVPGLRSEAEALREGSMAKDRVHEAMRRLIGPGAVALGRAQ
nr:vWA domain-containing protein [Alphaproteobacteria bacterium]